MLFIRTLYYLALYVIIIKLYLNWSWWFHILYFSMLEAFCAAPSRSTIDSDLVAKKLALWFWRVRGRSMGVLFVGTGLCGRVPYRGQQKDSSPQPSLNTLLGLMCSPHTCTWLNTLAVASSITSADQKENENIILLSIIFV